MKPEEIQQHLFEVWENDIQECRCPQYVGKTCVVYEMYGREFVDPIGLFLKRNNLPLSLRNEKPHMVPAPLWTVWFRHRKGDWRSEFAQTEVAANRKADRRATGPSAEDFVAIQAPGSNEMRVIRNVRI